MEIDSVNVNIQLNTAIEDQVDKGSEWTITIFNSSTLYLWKPNSLDEEQNSK